MSYLLIPVFALSAFVFMFLSWAKYDSEKTKESITAFIIFIFMSFCLMKIYAPFYFHWCGRAIGLIVFTFCSYYVIDQFIAGNFHLGKRSDQNVWNALAALILFGVPSLIIGLSPRDSYNPYRRDGSIRKVLLRDLIAFNEDLTQEEGDVEPDTTEEYR